MARSVETDAPGTLGGNAVPPGTKVNAAIVAGDPLRIAQQRHRFRINRLARAQEHKFGAINKVQTAWSSEPSLDQRTNEHRIAESFLVKNLYSGDME